MPLLMISEDVDIGDAEHGVSPVLLCCSGVPVICEWRPEAAAEAAPKLLWPGYSLQRKDASYWHLLCFSMLLVIKFFEDEEMKVGNSISLWVAQKRISEEFFQNMEVDTRVFTSPKREKNLSSSLNCCFQVHARAHTAYSK